MSSSTFADASMTTNGFGNIYVCEINPYNDVGEYVDSYVEGESQPLSVINITPVYDNLPLYDRSGLNNMQIGVDWQTLHSPEYQEYINDFVSHVFFLWGDVDKGGCFFYKNNENSLLFFGMMYGLYSYQDGSDTKYAYFIRIGSSNGLSREKCSEVAIAFYGNPPSDLYPSFIMLSGSTATSNVIDVYDLNIDPIPPVPVTRYDVRRTGSLLDAVDNTSFYDTGFGNTLPYKMWRCLNEQVILSGSTQDITLIGGSWDGSSAMDIDINPNDKGGTSDAGGGSGQYPDKSDNTMPPDASGSNAPDAINSGFITLYNPTKQQIKEFNDYLFSDNITSEISNQLKKLIADPIDYLVFIAQCRFQPQIGLNNEEITFAGIGTDVYSKVIAKQWQTIDCGTVFIGEDTDSFQDYAPYSSAHIFLPYVGFRELPIEEIRLSHVTVKYQIDLLTGSGIAQVTVNRPNRSNLKKDANPSFTGLILEYECNVFEMLPISSTDFRNFYSGLMGVVGGAIGVASGNLGGLGAMGSAVLGMKTNVNRSGNASGSYGYFGGQTPFILISRPFQSYPENFAGYEGFPSNITMLVKDCKGNRTRGWSDGYIETDENTVWGTDIDYTWNQTTISAFDDEIEEIKQLFNSGVIVNAE
jgi:hypothetical protein